MKIQYNFRLLLLCTLFIAAGTTGFARQIDLQAPNSVNGKTYQSGDTLVIPDGTWSDMKITFISNGVAGKPVVLKAKNPGRVIMTGTSYLEFSGSYLEVSGLRFKDGYSTSASVIQFRTSAGTLANNCRLTDCSVESYNNPDIMKDYKWVSVYGRNNQVDHCYFVNKAHMGTMMVVWLVSGDTQTVNHKILNNYFGYRNTIKDSEGNELNGQETIRIGDSNTSLQPSGCLVESNYFERCSGEIEIISNKSCDNIYLNNLFFGCSGTLTLRHGNRCRVEGNWFFGDNAANSGGVRVIGEDHVVLNNYFQDLKGLKTRAALSVYRGVPDNELSSYAQVKNAKVMFNTVINCRSAMDINYGVEDQTLSAIGTTIAHNVAYTTTSSNTAVYDWQKSADMVWTNNILYGGTSTNKPSSGIITNVKPLFQSITADGYAVSAPASNTPLTSYKTGLNIPEATADIWGCARASSKMPGAMETGSVKTRILPSAANTGVSWMKSGTSIRFLNKENPVSGRFYYSPSRNEIVWEGETVLSNINLFQVDGKKIMTVDAASGSPGETVFSVAGLKQGLYVVVSESPEGKVSGKVFMK